MTNRCRVEFLLMLKNAVIWYLCGRCGRNVAVGYGVMSVGQAVLFALCWRYRDGDIVGAGRI
jgi:hypothetical protein